MFNPTTAYIDLEALSNNLRKVKSIANQSKILAMIKCNAYGHGAVQVAKKIESEVSAFGVMFLKEALELYEAGIRKPIVILTGFFDDEELSVVDEYGFQVVVHNFEQIKILEKSKLSKPLNIWFKIDTGMHRLGFQPHQVEDAYESLMLSEMVEKPFRFMTHFSDADDIRSDKTLNQVTCFKKTTGEFQGEWCMANSAAIINWPETRTDWVRPGILLYGVSPFDDRSGLDLGLEPVMTLASNVIAIHELEVGECIGYGSTFICPQKMRIGTVSIGYGDGYPQNTKDAPVLIDGIRSRLLGRVAMDMVGVDLTNIPNAKVGSKVTLWGKGLPIEEISKASGEIPYELFCRLTSRVRYKFCSKDVEI